MAGNRIWRIKRRSGAAGKPVVDDGRRAAFLTIEEIMGEEGVDVRTPLQRPAEIARPHLGLPRRVPVPGPARQPLTRYSPRFRFKRRFAIVALTLVLAILIGALVGSGLVGRGDGPNGYTARPGEAGAYGIPEVPGHPGGGG
ncbi:MAG TPA: hypothetical protein VLC48_11315 [Gemmatimonadota bacterium]|nr:hypothetical protein [Gemmatimonadota bacterium]